MKRTLKTRFTYHAPFGDQPERYEALRRLGLDLAESIDALCPDCPERDNALDYLDQVIMWSNASIARGEDPEG